MFVDACSGGGFRGVEIGVEAVEAVVDVFLPGGYAALRLADPRNVVLIETVVYHVGDERGWELTGSVRGNAP